MTEAASGIGLCFEIVPSARFRVRFFFHKDFLLLRTKFCHSISPKADSDARLKEAPKGLVISERPPFPVVVKRLYEKIPSDMVMKNFLGILNADELLYEARLNEVENARPEEKVPHSFRLSAEKFPAEIVKNLFLVMVRKILGRGVVCPRVRMMTERF